MHFTNKSEMKKTLHDIYQTGSRQQIARDDIGWQDKKKETGRRQDAIADLELVLAHEPRVHQVLQVWKALLHPEADRPHGHAVGQQHVPAHPKRVKS
jgi:hypothetical protein